MSLAQPGSSSLAREGYWWHRARTDLLGAVMAPHLAAPSRTLDVVASTRTSQAGLCGGSFRES